MRADRHQNWAMTDYLLLSRPEGAAATAINASHPGGLPGVRCASCGRTWASVGVSYPTADLDRLPREVRGSLAPVDVETFRILQREVAAHFGDGRPLPPGTALGPLAGRLGRPPESVEWLNPWCLLLSAETMERLRSMGVFVDGAAASLTMFGGRPIPERYQLVEIEIPVTGRLLDYDVVASPCPSCGYQRQKWPSDFVMDSHSVVRQAHLIRPTNLSTAVLASREFVNAAGLLRLPNLTWQRIAVK